MAIQRQSNIRFQKWDILRQATDHLIEKGIYESLVQVHAKIVKDPDGFAYSPHRMHGAMSGPLGYRRFLPWHRAYLIVFERALREFDKSLSIPYWDWNADEGRLVGFGNLMGLSSGRNLGTTPSEEPQRDRVPWFTSNSEFSNAVSDRGNYYTFARRLEAGPHNRGHEWIGGDMNSMVSPRDPVFWFHHAQIDRVWSIWQRHHSGERAYLSGDEAGLDPWGTEFSVESIDDISRLGDDSYEYT